MQLTYFDEHEDVPTVFYIYFLSASGQFDLHH
jgi:hypothetical protein